MDRTEAFHDDTMGTDTEEWTSDGSLIDQYRQMHASSDDMFAGMSLMPHIHRIKRLIDQTGAKTILDYGCGKGKQYERPIQVGKEEYPNLEAYWGVEVWKYDPAHPPFSHDFSDQTYDGVICTDVLEHAENGIQAACMLDEIMSRARHFVFASISCREAIKTLPDGRNAHTCIEPPEFWRGMFTGRSKNYPRSWKIVCNDVEKEYVFANDGLEQTLVNAKQALQVKTKNCVSHENIVEQVKFTQSLGLNWVQECKAHDHKAVFVSAGPSWKNFIPEIRERYKAGDHIYCVKHSHDGLIEAGIVPYGCFLLDPRDHVKDFVENPHAQVRYIAATMCHPTTIRQLMEHDAKIWLYHALVGAGEDKVATKGLLVPGGSCSATRGLVVLRLMGYRHMSLYGYDSCFYDVDLDKKAEDAGKVADLTVKTFAANGFDWTAYDNMAQSIAGIREEAKKFIKVEIDGKEFTTTAELVAASQDFQTISAQMSDVTFEVHGDGMVPATWNQIQAKKAKQVDFGVVFG